MERMHGEQDYRSLSFWLDSVPGPVTRGTPLPGDLDVDVAIAGAGYTGLWTAYYLAGADPSLRIAVCEAEIAGFGASGRNGGWCSALFPASMAKLARLAGRDAARAMYLAMQASVDEVGRVAAAEGIDCHWAKGGTVALARSPAQLERARAEIVEAREFGFGEADLRLLTAAEASAMAGATSVLGGTYTPHCAVIHPARLARGLAAAVTRRGVKLFEGTPVTEIAPGRLQTTHGTVRASHVIRATEGYTARLPGLRRAVTPLYSLMIATEPLPETAWAQIGLAARPSFSDHRNMIIYGQRTADGRLAFGGRGAPYHLGSAIRPEFDREPAVFAALRATLAALFPAVGGARITHTWGGPLGVPRDWCASAGLDRATGLGWAGGYVGDGVSTTNLAGRTLADLVLGNASDLTRLPWVNHRSRRWEPEPLRWLGINGGLRAMGWADRHEARTGRPSQAAKLMGRFLGGLPAPRPRAVSAVPHARGPRRIRRPRVGHLGRGNAGLASPPAPGAPGTSRAGNGGCLGRCPAPGTVTTTGADAVTIAEATRR
jgi:glycine/D-amino acid oxidase-like deaminating enzyme